MDLRKYANIGIGFDMGGDPNNPAPYQPTPDQNLIQEAIDAASWSPIYRDAAGNAYREKVYTYANPTAWSTGESNNPYEIGGLGQPNSPEGTSTRKIYEFLDAQGNPINRGALAVPVGYDAPSQGGLIDFVQENGWVVPLALATAGVGTELAAGAGAASGGGLTGASGAGGAMGAGSSLQLAPAAMGAGTGVGGGIVAPSLATGLGVGAGGVLGAGALSAESVALLEAMNAGAGYGLNASQVPNLAAGLELSAIPSGSSLLSNLGTAQNVLKGAQLAKGLLGAGQNPLQAQAVGAQPTAQATGKQYAGVDYSPILNLLALKSPERNRNSLLG